MALTDSAIRHAKTTGKAYTLNDGFGLAFYVSANGIKSWHFRYSWQGQRARISFGMYPAISLKQARQLRDEAKASLANFIDPRCIRRQQQEIRKDTFENVFKDWFAHKQRSLEDGRQSTLSQINRIFSKDILPVLAEQSITTIKRRDLLTVLKAIERREAFTVAEKCRAWFNQLFRYALVTVEELEINPASDLDIVAAPKPPVAHNPYLRMHELPTFLQTLSTYQGSEYVKLGLRLLLLTGVRTGELRFATPDQFDLQQALWRIPAHQVKQLKRLARKKGKDNREVPPYLVPLPRQAMDIVVQLLARACPAQRYLLPHRSDLKKSISENTLNGALHRMGYADQLTGHGIRATLSTALNELNYQSEWIEAQLSHCDKDKVRAAYNHAAYVEQRRQMMQAWADRLDAWEA